MLETEDLCLDTQDNICTFEIFLSGKSKSQAYSVGNQCACVQTGCPTVTIDDCVEPTNHTSFCVCNFTKIVGCENYSTPITTSTGAR